MGFSTLTIHTEPDKRRSLLPSASARRPVLPASGPSLSSREQKKQRGEGFGANARRTGERQKGDSR
jgi:hypothetical protein